MSRRLLAGVSLAMGVVFVVSTSGQTPREPVAVFTETPPTWFEDFAKVGDVSPDGRWAIYGVPGARKLIDLQTGREVAERFSRGLDRVRDGVFLPDGTIARRGTRGGRDGWFLGDEAVRQVGIPADTTVPRWSAKGRVAFTGATGGTAILVGEEDARTTYDFGKRVVGLAWMLDGATILVLTREADGGSSLLALDADSGITMRPPIDLPRLESYAARIRTRNAAQTRARAPPRRPAVLRICPKVVDVATRSMPAALKLTLFSRLNASARKRRRVVSTR